MIEKPKKERRFLKALGRVGEILLQEVLIKIGSNLIKKIGGKKTLPSILFLLASLSLFAQYPNTGNKQRLGFQTTGDGLVWRGAISDTSAIQPINNQNAWVILDTVNLKIYSFDFTSNTWNLVGGSGSTIDTASLSNRINLKLNISDTAAMLLPYAKKSYVDTAGRFYARQDFSNVSTSTLNWTQTDTLIPAGVNVVQVYRNGQILLPSQYTIPTSTSVVIAATSFKVGENYTVIFPKGGGGSGGGSGSLTSISGGTGITVSPNPITTTGTVSADLSVLMELSDTSLLNLTSRFAAKQNTLVSGTNIKTVNSNSLLGSGNISVGTLVAADTISLSNRINTKDTGTVTSVATGYGLSGGTITSTGTLVLDSAVVFSRIRDSIVDVAIGNDTIKILKQEYAPATTSVLTWTITPKFPIQLKAYILVFRNGQLLINDQYNLTDTNKITIVSNSFKVGSNYTVVTVSGIGSVGTGVFPNPVYPEAGIAVSTGTTWTTSISNNSSNWNIAFNDKINNAAFSGTNTKTLTLTQHDGGTFAPTFTDLQGIVAADTASMLTNYLRSGVAASTYQTILTNPVTGTGTNNYIPKFTSTGSTIGNSTLIDNGSTILTSSILSTTNYASFNTTQVMSSLSGVLSTHRFTSANANGVYDKDYFLTSYMGAPWQGSDPGTGNRSKPPIVAIVNNNDPSFINSGLHLMTTNSTNNTYTPAITFGVNSENGSYYNTIGAITAKKLNTGQFTSLSAGQLEFFGTATTLDATGASMTTANMTLGVGVGIGYTTAPTVRGRLTVLEKLGINQSTPTFALDVSGTANITGATTLGSTLAVTDAVTLSTTTATPTSLLGKDGSNVVGNVRLISPLSLAGDSLNLSTVPISKGGTGAESASVARTTLAVGYVFVESTAGSSITLSSNRVSIVNAGGSSTTSIDLTTATNGRQYMIKNLASGTVISSASNVIPYTGGSAGTAILSAGNVTPQWVTLVADGTNWHIMQKN